ncbi:MAG: GNAT family protein [Actinomycetota bacterium]
MFTGKWVVLRRVEPRDYADIQRWQNDPEVFRWMDYTSPFSLEDIRASEERACAEGYPFVITIEGKAVGRIGLNNIRPRDRMASLYVFVGEESARGRGYGLDALVTLLGFAFEELDLRRVELWMLDGNDRALAVYKSAGFEEDARLPERSFKDGEYVAHVVMSVDRDGYAQARAALEV